MATTLSASTLANIINEQYFQRMWPRVSDLIGAFAIDGAIEAVEKVDTFDLTMHLSETHLFLDKVPVLQATANGATLRFPGKVFSNDSIHNQYALETVVEVGDIGTIWLKVRMAMELALGAAAPTTTTDIDVDHGAETFSGGLVELADLFGCVDLDEMVRSNFEDALGTALGSFSTLRFQPTTLDAPELLHVAGFDTYLDGPLRIVFVPDGFTDLTFFDAFTEACASAMLDDDPKHRNEPFARFRSVTGLWKLPLVSTNADKGTPERLAASFAEVVEGSSTVKTSLANLARYAAILHEIGAGSEHPPIIVIVSHTKVMDANARATAHGNLIILPVDGDAADAGVEQAARAQTFLHELGHTLLGGLGDEYTSGSSAVYRGPEPDAPNLSRQHKTGAVKWSKWLDGSAAYPAWDLVPVSEGNEGAFYHGKGVFRPAAACKMLASQGPDPFCAVCREALTLGIQAHLGDLVGVHLSMVEPLACPGWESWMVEWDLIGLTLHGEPQKVHMELVRASVPEPWTVTWEQRRKGRVVASSSGPTATVVVEDGDTVSVQIGTLQPFTPDAPPITLEKEIHFVGAHHVPTKPPVAPTEPSQDVPVGAPLKLTYAPTTGRRSFLTPLRLSAVAGGAAKYADPDGCILQVETELELTHGGSTDLHTKGPHQPGAELAWWFSDLEPGAYTWRVRTRFRDQTSGWVSPDLGTQPAHFTVAEPVVFPKPMAPADPVDLRWEQVPGAALKASLFATSWDVNGEALHLDFELVGGKGVFSGTGTASTALLLPSGGQSLRVEGSVEVPLGIANHRWKVRARSANGQVSSWVDGPDIKTDSGFDERWADWPERMPPGDGFPWARIPAFTDRFGELVGDWDLGRLGGLSVAQRDQRWAVDVDGQGAIDQITGASREERAVRARLNEAAKGLLGGESSRELAFRVGAPFHAIASRALTEALDMRARGAVAAVEVLGTAPYAGGLRRTVARLTHRGAARDPGRAVALVWRGDALIGLQTGVHAEGPALRAAIRPDSRDELLLVVEGRRSPVRLGHRGARVELRMGRKRTPLSRR